MTQRLQVVIVGAGPAGLYALYRLRQLGFDAQIVEAGGGVGGTWYWNRYPGARCDVESFQYSYSFSEDLQQSWKWSERFAAQPEIRAYLDHVANRFELRPHITLNCRIAKAEFDEQGAYWRLEAKDGRTFATDFCIMATGVLSHPRPITFPGQEGFQGDILSTAEWPEGEVDLADKRLAVIGTGASGTQALPYLAERARSVTVFQRTPNFSIPSPNAPVDEAYERRWKDNYAVLRAEQLSSPGAVLFDLNDRSAADATPAERRAEFERRWANDGGLNFMRAFNDLSSNERSNSWAADFVREKIAEIVKDPETARKLTPKDYPIDARRLATSDRGFYELFNRPNVALVSVLEEPIECITAQGVRTSRRDYPADVIVMATGFEPVTGALTAMDIQGVAKANLRGAWRENPGAYLGVAAAGFPNLFMIHGPGSPGPLANLFSSSEITVDWIAQCLVDLEQRGIRRIEAHTHAQTQWMADVQALADKTLMVKAPSSGYIYITPSGARNFICYSGGLLSYCERLRQSSRSGYSDFKLNGRVHPRLAISKAEDPRLTSRSQV